MRTKSKELSPLFLLIFITAAAFIVISLATSIWVAFWGESSSMQSALFENCMDGWKMGFATIVGLLGGKADSYSR